MFCKHKERDTYEVPGGHRELGESILDTAKRELSEETGAVEFEIIPICVYSVTGKNRVNQTGEDVFKDNTTFLFGMEPNKTIVEFEHLFDKLMVNLFKSISKKM